MTKTADAQGVIAALGCRLGEALGEAESSRARFASASVSAPVQDPLATFAGLGDVDGVYWELPSEGLAFAAMGCAADLAGSGANRFEGVQGRWQAAALTTVTRRESGIDAPALFGVGAFAFDGERAADAVWSSLPRNTWVVPQVVQMHRGGQQWLQCQVAVSRSGGGSEIGGESLSLAARVLEEAVEGGREERPMGGVVLDYRDDQSEGWWSEAVAAALGEIGRGGLEKVVLARRGSVVAGGTIDVPGLLWRLRKRFPTAAVFAVRRGDRTFVGASPERLVAVDGERIAASAVAGTSRPSGEGDGVEGVSLLDDPKERREHAMVVEAMRSALGPVCRTLAVPDAPELMVLPNLQHLYTPLTGTLAGPLSVLEAVALLHPTPAVGGVPAAAAAVAIGEWEPFDRGWYAGPIGWMDDAGNGEFFVALRSALVEGDRAYVYAGCGLVAGSEAAAEWNESRLKMGAVLCAL